jgi:hypothetical protein
MGKPAYRDYDITVAAGGEMVINAQGRFVACIESDQTYFDVALDNDGAFFFMAAGLLGRIEEGQTDFKVIKIRNPNAGTLTAKLIIGSGDLIDSRFVASGTLYVQAQVPENLVTIADVAVPTAVATKVLNTNTKRIEAFITNPDPAQTIRVGDSAIGAARGTLIQPNSTASLVTEDEIYVYQATGGSLNIPVSYTEYA